MCGPGYDFLRGNVFRRFQVDNDSVAVFRKPSQQIRHDLGDLGAVGP